MVCAVVPVTLIRLCFFLRLMSNSFLLWADEFIFLSYRTLDSFVSVDVSDWSRLLRFDCFLRYDLFRWYNFFFDPLFSSSTFLRLKLPFSGIWRLVLIEENGRGIFDPLRLRGAGETGLFWAERKPVCLFEERGLKAPVWPVFIHPFYCFHFSSVFGETQYDFLPTTRGGFPLGIPVFGRYFGASFFDSVCILSNNF